jgi:phosphatidate phosphatase APP1
MIPCRIALHGSLFALALGLVMSDVRSPIKSDEVVVFFPTFGRLDADGKTWRLPIHGWIFEPEENSIKRGLLLAWLRRSLGLEAGADETVFFKERARQFLVDNERGKRIAVRLGDGVHPLGESEANGHFHGEIRLSASDADLLLRLQGSNQRWLTFQAVTGSRDARIFRGQVQLVAPGGWSVVSDVDDTIKISEVLNKKALLANTFLREFEAVPGMAELYQDWARAGASFHYVSASPWQLYQPLAGFTEKAGFPRGTFHMKDFRWKDSTFFNLFASPEEYKPPVIEPILKALPLRKFILVGDSGEKDPEVYGLLARKYPQQIDRILIRDVTDERPAPERYRKCFAGVPQDRWLIFRSPGELEGAFRELKE